MRHILLIVIAMFAALLSLHGAAYPVTLPPTLEPPIRKGFLGLRQAIELGVAHHPVLQEGSANVKAAEARTEQARSLY